MKKNYILLVLLFASVITKAQTTGNFSNPIQFNATMHNVEYYVPTSYNSANSYPLLVALHGCGGDAVSYRNSFVSIADSIGAILVCPDNMGGQISGMNGQIIPDVIDSTINQLGYNINTSEVYLTGYSCNGQETMKQGWNNVYPFKGLIPLNSWVPNLTGYNFNSKIPTCICSGTADGSYNNNSDLHDSLVANGGVAKFNSMPGVPHVSSFATRDAELMECFNWIDSQAAPNAIIQIGKKEVLLNAYPNPANLQLNLSIQSNETVLLDAHVYDIYGKLVKETKLSSVKGSVLSVQDLTSGVYIIRLYNNGLLAGNHKFMIAR